MSERLILIDGHALVYRAFHALPPLTSPKGEDVNAVYGFMSMLLKVCTDLKPDYLVATFDTSSQTFRRAEFEAYKATRTAAPEGLHHQVDLVQRLLQAMQVPIYRLAGYEADDLLGTLSCQAAQRELDTIILTGDTDALQLVGPRVRVLTSRRGFTDTVLYDEAQVAERYGLSPRQLTDLRGLRGDSSDNIPGVPGVGDKTAARLLSRFGTVEELFAHLDELPTRQRDQLKPYGDQVTLSKRLATIVCDLDVQLDLDQAELSDLDSGAVREMLHELGFRSLIERLAKLPTRTAVTTSAPAASGRAQLGLFDDAASTAATASAGPDSSDAPVIVRDPGDVAALAAAMRQANGLAIAAEGSVRDPMRATWSAWPSPATPCHHPICRLVTRQSQPSLSAPSPRSWKTRRCPSSCTMPRIRASSWPARGSSCRVSPSTRCSRPICSSPGARTFELRDVAWNKLQVEVPPLTSLIGTGRKALTLDDVGIEQCASYAIREADLTARLTPVLRRELAECNLDRLYAELELPLVPVLAAMELIGVSIDVPYLQQLSTELHGRLQEIEREAFAAVGHQFNLNSPKQLSEVLFDELSPARLEEDLERPGFDRCGRARVAPGGPPGGRADPRASPTAQAQDNVRRRSADSSFTRRPAGCIPPSTRPSPPPAALLVRAESAEHSGPNRARHGECATLLCRVRRSARC